jgi:hypothetical protein
VSTSVSYDYLNLLSHKRQAVLYLVIGHNDPLPANITTQIRTALSQFDLSAAPSIKRVAESKSPIEALSSEWVTFIKWPIRSKVGLFSPDTAGEIRQLLRSKINQALISQGCEILQTDVKAINDELTNDHDIPPTPQAELANIPIWPAALLGAFALPALLFRRK